MATLVACQLVFPQHFLLLQMLTCVYLTNRSHLILLCVCSVVDHRLRCKNKQVAHEVIAECVTHVLTTFWDPLWSITNRYMATCNLFVLYNKKTYYSFFISKSFTVTRKPAFAHFGKHKKKPHWSRKIRPLSNLT